MVAEDERGQSDEEVPNKVNPLQLLNALSAEGNSKGLSYVQVEMNGIGLKQCLILVLPTILLMKVWSNSLV